MYCNRLWLTAGPELDAGDIAGIDPVAGVCGTDTVYHLCRTAAMLTREEHWPDVAGLSILAAVGKREGPPPTVTGPTVDSLPLPLCRACKQASDKEPLQAEEDNQRQND